MAYTAMHMNSDGMDGLIIKDEGKTSKDLFMCVRIKHIANLIQQSFYTLVSGTEIVFCLRRSQQTGTRM